MGCHLTRKTVETARGLGFAVESERTRFFGVFRLEPVVDLGVR
jgi:hypothetical protein